MKLYNIYIYFGYVFINKLYNFLNKIKYNIKIDIFKKINKFYYYY